MGADEIVAYGNSMVGSIGVLFQIPNVSTLLDRVGVKLEEIKSSPLKAAPNGLTPTSEEAKQAMDRLVKDSYAWFKDLVKERRKLSDADLAVVSDGRVFTGRQGLELKLVDKLGGEREAIAWLESAASPKACRCASWKKKRSLETLGLLGLARAVAVGLGLENVVYFLDKTAAVWEMPKLDGLLSVWHFS